MMNNNFTGNINTIQHLDKDQMFCDLPHEIKVKIVQLQKKSEETLERPILPPFFREFDDIDVPQSKKIYNEFISIVNNTEVLKSLDKTKCQSVDIEKLYTDSVRSHNEFVESYKLAINDTDVVEEMETMLKMMKLKYDDITKKLF